MLFLLLLTPLLLLLLLLPVLLSDGSPAHRWWTGLPKHVKAVLMSRAREYPCVTHGGGVALHAVCDSVLVPCSG
jgi:hypothetical protein